MGFFTFIITYHTLIHFEHFDSRFILTILYMDLIIYNSFSASSMTLAISLIKSPTANSQAAYAHITPCCHSMATAMTPDASLAAS